MKHFKKVLVSVLAFAMIAAIGMTTFFAETYYEFDHFVFLKNDDGTITVSEFDNSSTDVVIPQTILDRTVSGVDAFIFSKNTNITSVVVPDTVKSIGNSAFANATNLVSAKISANCETVGVCLFQGCSSLKSVDINSKISVVNNQMFYKCPSLEEIVLPNTVQKINNYAFAECPSLKSVFIPESVGVISKTAFKKSDNVVISGYFGSYAQEFAEANNIAFKGISKYVLGDINRDGKINVVDATAIQKIVVGITTNPDAETKFLADYNCDGKINILDVTCVERIVVGLA